MIKKIAGYIGEYRLDTIKSPLFVILEVIMDIIIPFQMAKMIDNGVEKGNMQYVYGMGAVMVGTSLLALLFGVLSGKYAASASSGFARNLRKGMFDHIQEFSFSNIDKYSTAGLITRLTTDVTNVQNAFQMLIRMFVRAPIMLLSAVGMCIYINPGLSLVFVGAIVFLGFALFFIMTGAHPYFVKVFQKYDDLNASVQENLTGIRVVKAYVREDHENTKFQAASKVIYDYFVKAEKRIVFNTPTMQLTMYACIMLLSWFGARMIVSDTLTTGELMSLFTYATTVLISLMILSMLMVMVVMSRSSIERIAEVLDEKSDIVNGENPVYEVKDGSIEFRNVNFSYSKDLNKLNLESIHLTIHSGETIGVIGGTGSAKSTLVQLIPRLYDVTSGEVLVGGVDVREYDLDTLRNQVAMVLQKNVLFSGTIRENLMWGNPKATEAEMIAACQQARASEFIAMFPQKYDTYIEQGGSNVSGGQKQRLCIARALLKKPKILILDDSTSAVDMKTDALIRKAFRENIPDTTKIIIAQRIASVCDADKIIVMNDGRIDGYGTHQELLASNDIYREVYESQTKGGATDEEKTIL